MKQGIFTLSLVLLGLLSYGQTGTIRGTVTQQEDGEAVLEAFVKVAGSETGTITDLDGVYTIEIEPGVYTIEITHLTFNSKTFTNIKVSEGSVTIVNAKMGYGEASTLGTADISFAQKEGRRR